ncbi:MAG: mechanosensitive ion channel family protein [Candidatus Electrothrix sp. YB6]
MNEHQNLFLAWLQQSGVPEHFAVPITYGLATVLILLFALLATWVVRHTLVRLLIHMVTSNRLQWDDILVKNIVFRRLSWVVPILIFHLAQDMLLPPDSQWVELLRRVILCGFILVGVGAINALLKSVNDIYRFVHHSTGKTIRGYIDAVKIIIYLLCVILLISILTDRSPWGLLSVMGGLTALILLAFRDTILGFIASILLTGRDIIRVGDWIEMESHGADGDVIEVSIHSVRVRNWNKTITTIPTYALVANPFKNWRGMSESGGRRIKRALLLDMTSIRFLNEKELEKLSEIQVIKDYIRTKQKEIDLHNKDRDMALFPTVNGRCQTNIGLFRAYTIAWLKQNPNIHQQMTFLVRQLAPGPTGLPLEIYVFSRDQVWANYEAIQADIFDHLIAALPYFDLRLFQQPSGYDLRQLGIPAQHGQTQ